MFALTAGAGAGAALAQPADGAPASGESASPLHQQGRDLARQWLTGGDRAKLERAAALFKEALALAPSPLVECDLGLALFHLGELSRAHARLTSCMPRLAIDAPDQVDGYKGVAASVDAAVARAHVAVDVTTSPPGAVVSISSFPADETVLAPTLVWLPAGRHTFTARAAGHQAHAWTVEIGDDDVTARARKRWQVRLEPVPAGAVGPARDREPPPGLVGDAPPRRSRTAATLTLAAGGALLAGGGVLHYLGRDVRAELATLSGDAYQDQLGTWHLYQRSTIGLYATGALATGVGVWLYLRARAPAPIAVTPTAEGRGAMVWVWSWSAAGPTTTTRAR